MGTVETALLLKYGLPLALRLVDSNIGRKEALATVTSVCGVLAAEGDDKRLLGLSDTETEDIVSGFMDVALGVSSDLGKLLDLLLGGE